MLCALHMRIPYCRCPGEFAHTRISSGQGQLAAGRPTLRYEDVPAVRLHAQHIHTQVLAQACSKHFVHSYGRRLAPNAAHRSDR